MDAQHARDSRRCGNSPGSALRYFAMPQGQYARTGASHRDDVLELRRQLAIAGVYRPLIRLCANDGFSLIEHWLDGERHAFFELKPDTTPAWPMSPRHVRGRAAAIPSHMAL